LALPLASPSALGATASKSTLDNTVWFGSFYLDSLTNVVTNMPIVCFSRDK
jgi:hypothetical protein